MESQYAEKLLFVFDPKQLKVVSAVKRCIDYLKNLQMRIQFHLIEKPQNACALITDQIKVDKRDYEKYANILPQGCLLYDGKQTPMHVVLIGDGEMFLRCARLFQNMDTPYILSFANGQDPRNYNFVLSEIDQVFPVYLEEISKSRIPSYQSLMKLSVKTEDNKSYECVDDIQFHRGMASVLKIESLIQNDCFQEPVPLANLWGDGVIISTPMGSLGRSLTLHGPLMHKQMNCILMVPNCPLSLKFRPVCLPITNKIIIYVQKSSRAPAIMGIDGMNRGTINQDSAIQISYSKYKLRLVVGMTRSYDITWLNSLKKTINWAQNYSPIQNHQYKKYIKKKSFGNQTKKEQQKSTQNKKEQQQK